MTPSSILGFEPGTYEAYCLDEAVTYFGMRLEHELEQVGHKPSKEERRAIAARERLLDKVFDEGTDKKKAGFADPALRF